MSIKQRNESLSTASIPGAHLQQNAGMLYEAAPFQDWCPATYLADYYARVEPDEQHTLRFLVQEFRKLSGYPLALEFGIGPTLHHLIPLSPHVREIHAADFVAANLAEVRKWQNRERGAHDWTAFTETVLRYEGRSVPGPGAIHDREDLTRWRITRLLAGDAGRPTPLGPQAQGLYPCVLSCYCADSAAGDRATWSRYMANILSLLAPGGFFVTAALRNCRAYRVGGRFFPGANVNEYDFADLFERHGFEMSRTTIAVAHVLEHRANGYDSIVLASGFKGGG